MTKQSPRIISVDSLSELFNRNFDGHHNQINFTRKLKGHYNLLAWRLLFMEPAIRKFKLEEYAGIAHSNKKPRRSVLFGDAAEQILSDMKAALESGKKSVQFRVVSSIGYPLTIRSFHLDGGKSTMLFLYNEPATETVDNEDVIPHWRFKEPRYADIREGATIYKSHAGDVIKLKAVPLDCQTPLDENARFHRAPAMGFFNPPRLVLIA